MARPAQLDVVSSVEQVFAGGLLSLYVTLVAVQGGTVNIGSLDVRLLLGGLLVSLFPCCRKGNLHGFRCPLGRRECVGAPRRLLREGLRKTQRGGPKAKKKDSVSSSLHEKN